MLTKRVKKFQAISGAVECEKQNRPLPSGNDLDDLKSVACVKLPL